MIAAIYARKSTEQTGIADEQKSVARQIEHARQYAARKGWTVSDEHMYVDDGLSGAEFSARPGFVRLMSALKPRPPFQVLIMSEESRLGREAIETMQAFKTLMQASVCVFVYLEDREIVLGSFQDNTMAFLRAQFAAEEREKSSKRTSDTMHRRARAGHVTSGQYFGYRNVEITAPGPDGKLHRQFVRREVDPDHAAVIRRIFELCAGGAGLKGITKTLNAEGTPVPRSQRGRPRAWAPSSVRAILYRDSYRGVLVWNKSRKRNHWGQKQQRSRPQTEWITVPAEELRIVSDRLWAAAHARRTTRRENYRLYGRRAPDGRGVRNTTCCRDSRAVRSVVAPCRRFRGSLRRGAYSGISARPTGTGARRSVATDVWPGWR